MDNDALPIDNTNAPSIGLPLDSIFAQKLGQWVQMQNGHDSMFCI